MKEYVIITQMYESQGGSFKYAINPRKQPYKISFNRSDREQFIEKWKYILNENMYFDPPKVFFVNYDNCSIINITEKLFEIENNI